MDVKCVVIRLKEDCEQRAHEWAKVVNSRKDEALQTIKDEGVLVESAFIMALEEHAYLIYYIRAHNLEKAEKVAKASVHDIDAYHKAFKQEAWGERIDTHLLIDLSQS